MVSCSLISPSYTCTNEEKKISKKNLKKIGFKKILNFSSKEKFFDKWAGSPEERLKSFYGAWNSNSEVLMACKGGSGASHILSLINKKKLNSKKLFVGYSDITMLLNFISYNLKIVTFHGPNCSKNLDDKSISALKDALEMKNYGIKFKVENCLNIPKNSIKGRTIGGNLGRLLETTDVIPLDFRNKIVFFEETNFSLHKIFNLMVSFKNYPNFKPKAIIFGDLGIKDKSLFKKMAKYLFPQTPLIFDLPFGHVSPNIAIPIRSKCVIDFKEQKIKFIFGRKDKKNSVNL